MLKFRKSAVLVASLVMLSSPVMAGKLGLGRVALPAEIAAWDLDISPDGTGLPAGSGDAIVGEELFAEKCASCHGDFAEGIDNWPKLSGGNDTLDHDDPLKTVGSYWPYLSTVIDYVKRSMPFGAAGTLTDDEVYALVAYILFSNDLIEDDFVLSNETFRDVKMPNADGFIVDDRSTAEYAKWTGEPCMTNCKSNVQITMRARVLDVTPVEETAAAETPVQTAEVQVVEAASAPLVDPELAAAGEKVFRKCKSCHQVGDSAKNKVGPVLNGIVGKAAGSVDGFKYSKALLAAAEDGLTWGPDEMAAFLAKPKSYLKGTKMSFAGLRKDEEVAAIIAYLSSLDQ